MSHFDSQVRLVQTHISQSVECSIDHVEIASSEICSIRSYTQYFVDLGKRFMLRLISLQIGVDTALAVQMRVGGTRGKRCGFSTASKLAKNKKKHALSSIAPVVSGCSCRQEGPIAGECFSRCADGWYSAIPGVLGRSKLEFSTTFAFRRPVSGRRVAPFSRFFCFPQAFS